MKKKRNYLLPLLMAIVMMAMSPQKVWAENLTVDYDDNITISSDATYDNVIVNDGTLTIKNGATVKINNDCTFYVSGGAVIIESGATVTFLEDAYLTISDGKTFNYGTINGNVYLSEEDYCFANWGTVKGDVYNVDNNNNCVNFYNFGTIEGQVTDIVKASDSCVNHNGTNFEATCTDAGFTRCNECGEIISTTPASGHTLTAHPAAAATCTTAGYSSDCWSCSVCGKYFSDAAGNNEIAASSVVIPAGHNFVNGICSVCGTGSIVDSEVTDDNGNTITISTVVGNVVLTEEALYKKLVLSNNATLTINQGVTLHVDAMEVGAGCKVTNSGTISYYTYMYDINIYGNFVNLGTIEYGTLKLYDDATACNHGTVGYNAAIYGEYSVYYSTSGGKVCYPLQGGTLDDAIYPGTTSSVSVPATCTTAGTEKISCDVCGTTLSETPTAIDPNAHNWENNTCTVCAAVKITYTASAKLAETTDEWSAGLHTNAFGSATIASHTFENGVGTITFSGELTSIGYNAFYKCSALTGITIPSGVTSIGEGAFDSCTNLTGITIPSGVTSIGEFAFSVCSNLASITIPSSVTSVGEMSFLSCYVTSSNLHNSSSIDLTQYDLTIVDTEQEDGLLIKDNCAVTCRPGATSLNIPSSVTSIGAYAFNERSNLSSITFTTPSSVTSIGEYAFYKCSNLASITIPGSVTSIGTQAFYCCSNLTSVTIPSSVTSIGGGAFLLLYLEVSKQP